MPAGSERGSPSTVSETGRPAARVRSTSAPSRAMLGCGARSSPWCMTPSRRRISVIAARPTSSMWAAASIGARGVALEDAARAARLHDHHRDRVGDHVVHLARDPAALVGRRAGDLLLVRLLRLHGGLVQLLGEPRARAHAAAGEPGEQHEGGREDVVGEDLVLPRGRHAGHPDHDHERREPGVAALGVGAHRVAHEERADERHLDRLDLVRPEVEEDPHREHHGARDQRPAAAPEQREVADGDDRDAHGLPASRRGRAARSRRRRAARPR